MNVVNTPEHDQDGQVAAHPLLRQGFEPFDEFSSAAEELRDTLSKLRDQSTSDMSRRLGRLIRQLDSFEPSVTMIGQIKSGKTSLVNAMIGSAELLPADVNPWTSVVTSLHLYPPRAGFEQSAVFKFFEEDEWDRLVTGGGRVGELASRVGAENELAKIKAQVAEMREKSRARLGRKFELLLGQQHEYGYFDQELIERYVCLGDEPDEQAPTAAAQGRFADITKSADLHMQGAHLPWPLCLRDTPGVNDTFMMREQITIKAIRDSRICVVVLSAHQALSSADLAIIRLISNIKSRDVIIFVNRIDELSDPAKQVPQIRESIQKTLVAHNGPTDAELLFGSAIWALHALKGEMARLPTASVASFDNWASYCAKMSSDPLGASSDVWALSGIPSLHRAISNRVAQGAGRALLARISDSAKNLANGMGAVEELAPPATGPIPARALTVEEAQVQFVEIVRNQIKAMSDQYEVVLSEFSTRLDRIQASFLERATASLLAHLDKFGEKAPWTYDPSGLRALLSSSHKVVSRKSDVAFQQVMEQTAEKISALYLQAFGVDSSELGINLPRPPRIAPPVNLGRTIALDLNSSWWKRWWFQRRGYQAYAANFTELIRSETEHFIQEMQNDTSHSLRSSALELLNDFLKEQDAIFESLAKRQVSIGSEITSQDQSSQRKQNTPQSLARLKKRLEAFTDE